MMIQCMPPEILVKIFFEANRHFRVRATSRLFRDLLTDAKPELTYIVGFPGGIEENSKLKRARGTEASNGKAVIDNLVDLAGKFTLSRIRLNNMVVPTSNNVSPALGPHVRHLGLTHMYVTMKWLAPGLSTCSNLGELTLFDVPLCPEDLDLLGKVLPTSLRGLTVNQVDMREEHTGMAGFAAGLARLYALEYLNVSNNRFVQCAALGVAMRKLTNLMHFECCNEDLDTTGFEQLLDGLVNNSNLRVLKIHMEGVDLTKLGLQAQDDLLDGVRRIVAKLSSTAFPNMQRLCISGPRLEHNIMDLRIQSCRLLELKIENCLIDDDGLISLLAGLEECHHLESLDLGYNYITDEGMEHFVRFAHFHMHLDLLRVDGNEATHPTLRRIGNRLRELGVRFSCDYSSSESTLDHEAAPSVTHADIFGESDSDMADVDIFGEDDSD